MRRLVTRRSAPSSVATPLVDDEASDLTTASKTDRRFVLSLALRADCIPRTARRAIENGVHTIKGAALRERIRLSAFELGIELRDDEEGR